MSSILSFAIILPPKIPCIPAYAAEKSSLNKLKDEQLIIFKECGHLNILLQLSELEQESHMFSQFISVATQLS